MTEKHASWFWYGRYEGAMGGYVPPKGLMPHFLYLIGNAAGRRFGPPAPREQVKVVPWGINTIGSLYHPDVHAELPDGRYVAAVCTPCPPSLRERLRAACWVFTGRAHAFIWPKAGDLEAVWTRDNPVRRPTPRPFVPQAGATAPLPHDLATKETT